MRINQSFVWRLSPIGGCAELKQLLTGKHCFMLGTNGGINFMSWYADCTQARPTSTRLHYITAMTAVPSDLYLDDFAEPNN